MLVGGSSGRTNVRLGRRVEMGQSQSVLVGGKGRLVRRARREGWQKGKLCESGERFVCPCKRPQLRTDVQYSERLVMGS